MIAVLRTLFGGAAAPRTELPLDICVAALLIEAARADGVYDAEERAAVLRLLQDMFGLSSTEVVALHDRADTAQGTAVDTVRFTRVVKMAMDEEQRIQLMQALWHVVLVDHERDPQENAFLRHLAPLLGVDDRHSVSARHRAMALLGKPEG
jgi:uncharacterized tellurite resistance protein B-like protein